MEEYRRLTEEKLDKMNLDINGIPNLTNGE